MKSVPDEKYQELQEAFPDQFVFFFDCNGELNNQGKMAMQNLAMKNLLSKAEFVFDSEKELITIVLGFIPVSNEAHPSALNELAAEFLSGVDLPPVCVKSQEELEMQKLLSVWP